MLSSSIILIMIVLSIATIYIGKSIAKDQETARSNAIRDRDNYIIGLIRKEIDEYHKTRS